MLCWQWPKLIKLFVPRMCKGQCLQPVRTRNVKGRCKQAYAFPRVKHTCYNVSDAELSFITTSMTTNKSTWCFHFKPGVCFQKHFWKCVFVCLFVFPVDTLLHLVFQRQLVVIFTRVHLFHHDRYFIVSGSAAVQP